MFQTGSHYEALDFNDKPLQLFKRHERRIIINYENKNVFHDTHNYLLIN